jgi:hypothetical protein
VILRNSFYRIAYPVTAEAYVSQVLDRAAFRRHCDQYRTQAEILKHLPWIGGRWAERSCGTGFIPEVCPHLNRSAAEIPQKSELDQLG